MPGNVQPQPTVAIQTHGCKLNQADSAQLARRFSEAGYRIVESVAEADVYVLNTCTVTAGADSKARQALRSARRQNPGALVVATGCYSQRAAEELTAMSAVSLVVLNTEKERLVSLVEEAEAGREGMTSTDPGEAGPVSIPTGTKTKKLGRLRAMVKIQEGCDQVCAYCIVPRVRGRERSIPPEVLVQQVNQEVAEGAREVVLTGTQLGTYGFDLPDINLTGLLRRLLAETGVQRLRVSSLQAHEINGELLDLWQDRRLCPHFHLPLQSGSDRILAAMRRRYDATRFAQTVELIRQNIPEAGITTDIIVGFPGEGRAEFEESFRFADAMRFSDGHIFPYSIRPGTSAAYLPGQVGDRDKRERMDRMLAMTAKHFRKFRQQALGQTRRVLWESVNRGAGGPVWSGLTDNYIRVSAQHPGDLRNTVTQARLEELTGQSVKAAVL